MKVTGTDGKKYTVKPDANLRDAKLRGANLISADLSKANLRGANLRWASLREAKLVHADLSGAIWSDETVFPEGFEIPDELQG